MNGSRVVNSSPAQKLSAVLPIVACMFCPAHLLALGTLLSPLGIHFAKGTGSEWPVIVLAALSLALIARTALRSGSRWPLALASAAALLLAGARLLHLSEQVELAGLALLTLASIWAQLARPAACCGGHEGPHGSLTSPCAEQTKEQPAS